MVNWEFVIPAINASIPVLIQDGFPSLSVRERSAITLQRHGKKAKLLLTTCVSSQGRPDAT